MDYLDLGLQKATNSQISLKSQMKYLYEELLEIFFEKLSRKECNDVYVTIRKFNGVPEVHKVGSYSFTRFMEHDENKCCDIVFTIKQVDLNELSKQGTHIIEISIYDREDNDYIYYHSDDIDFVKETSNMRYPFHLLVEEDYV